MRIQVKPIQNEPRKPGDGKYICDLCFVEGDKKGTFHEKKNLLKHQKKCHPEHFLKSSNNIPKLEIEDSVPSSSSHLL